MATSCLKQISIGLISAQSGNGSPDHTAPMGTTYTNIETGLRYRNINGTTTWMLLDTSFTGGTVVGDTVFTGILSANTIDTTNLNIDGNDIYSIFVTQANETKVTGFTYNNGNIISLTDSQGGSFSVNLSMMSGVTFSGDVISHENLYADKTLTATTISGNILKSGSTNLYSIFQTIGSDLNKTYIQPGSNITTGGTSDSPIINLTASPSVNNFTASGNTSLQIVSATTLYSGSTNLYNIFETLGSNEGVMSIEGVGNITTGGTSVNPTIAITSTPSFGAITSSGSSSFSSGLTASTLSGGNIYSGSTNLSSIFLTPATARVTREVIFSSKEMALNTATNVVLTPLVMAVTRFNGTGGVTDAGLSFVVPDDYYGEPDFYFTWRATASGTTSAKTYIDIYTGTTNELGSLTTVAETLSFLDTPTNANTFLFSPTTRSSLGLSADTSVHLRIYRNSADVQDTFTGTLDMINFVFKYKSIG